MKIDVKTPNFLLIGAPKAGTTSIAAYLGQHPEIFISEEKEPFYFMADLIDDIAKDDPMLDAIIKKARVNWDDYLKLFENANESEKLRGEATVHYLYHYDTVIPKVLEKLGDIPMVIILRDPVTRAYSNYTYQSRGQINSFEEALELEEDRKDRGWNSFWFYKETGKYCKPVSAFLDNFTNVYIGTFEDFKNDSIGFMQKIYDFLGVDEHFVPQTAIKHNPTLVPKSKLLQTIYYFLHKYKINTGFVPKSLKQAIRRKAFKKNTKKINPDTSRRLYDYFKEDIDCLEKKLGKDMRAWKAYEQ